MVDMGSAIVGKVGVEAYKSASPSLFRWLKRLVFGKTVLFLGPSFAGKTSYVTYLRSGELANPNEFADRTIGHRNSGGVIIKSANGNVEVDLAKIMDTQGQGAPQEHAELVAEYRPHAICLMFDASEDWSPLGVLDPSKSNKVWLETFLIKLCKIANGDDSLFERIKSFAVVLNKVDLVKDQSTLQGKVDQVHLLVGHHLKGDLGDLAAMLVVKPMSAIQGYAGDASPEKVTSSLFMPFIRG
jgi:hypothetical protein